MIDLTTTLESALRTSVHEEGNAVRLQTYQDVEPHLRYAEACRREDWERRGAFGKRAEFRRTMSIPTNVMMMVAQKLGIAPKDIFNKEHSKRIMRELKSGDYSKFRTVCDKRI